MSCQVPLPSPRDGAPARGGWGTLPPEPRGGELVSSEHQPGTRKEEGQAVQWGCGPRIVAGRCRGSSELPLQARSEAQRAVRPQTPGARCATLVIDGLRAPGPGEPEDKKTAAPRLHGPELRKEDAADGPRGGAGPAWGSQWPRWCSYVRAREESGQTPSLRVIASGASRAGSLGGDEHILSSKSSRIHGDVRGAVV